MFGYSINILDTKFNRITTIRCDVIPRQNEYIHLDGIYYRVEYVVHQKTWFTSRVSVVVELTQEISGYNEK
jgi:hypothetical protein